MARLDTDEPLAGTCGKDGGHGNLYRRYRDKLEYETSLFMASGEIITPPPGSIIVTDGFPEKVIRTPRKLEVSA